MIKPISQVSVPLFDRPGVKIKSPWWKWNQRGTHAKKDIDGTAKYAEDLSRRRHGAKRLGGWRRMFQRVFLSWNSRLS